MLSPRDIDLHIGARLKYLRTSRGLTQEQVGDAIGVSLQQVQKYEHGTNRMAANNLWRLAAFFDVEISYFFRGLRDDQLPVTNQEQIEIGEIALRLHEINDENVRRKVIALINTFIE